MSHKVYAVKERKTVATPSAADTGFAKLYFKADGELYKLIGSTETAVSGGGGSVPGNNVVGPVASTAGMIPRRSATNNELENGYTVTTTVGTPGVDTALATEKAVRDAINAASGTGEVNTASNLGAGEGVFASKSGADLQFKSLVAGTNVTLSSTGNDITINATGGEANTASNLGSGHGVFGSKSGVDLQLKSIVAGANVTITDTTNEITIAASAGGGTQRAVTVDSSGADYTSIDAAVAAGATCILVKTGDTISSDLEGISIKSDGHNNLTFNGDLDNCTITNQGDITINGVPAYNNITGASIRLMNSVGVNNTYMGVGLNTMIINYAGNISLNGNIFFVRSLEITSTDNGSITIDGSMSTLNLADVTTNTSGAVSIKNVSNTYFYLNTISSLILGDASLCTFDFRDNSSVVINSSDSEGVVITSCFFRGDSGYSTNAIVVKGNASDDRVQFNNNNIGGSLKFEDINRGMLCNNMAASLVTSTGCSATIEVNNSEDFL